MREQIKSILQIEKFLRGGSWKQDGIYNMVYAHRSRYAIQEIDIPVG
jgi:hypothetical protein